MTASPPRRVAMGRELPKPRGQRTSAPVSSPPEFVARSVRPTRTLTSGLSILVCRRKTGGRCLQWARPVVGDGPASRFQRFMTHSPAADSRCGASGVATGSVSLPRGAHGAASPFPRSGCLGAKRLPMARSASLSREAASREPLGGELFPSLSLMQETSPCILRHRQGSFRRKSAGRCSTTCSSRRRTRPNNHLSRSVLHRKRLSIATT